MNESFERVYQQWRQGHDDVAGRQKLFLVGCPKSGTTWLMNLLNGHDEVVVCGEGAFAWQLVPMLTQAFRAFNQHQKKMKPIVQLRDIDLLLVARTIIDSQFSRYVTESASDPARIRVVGDKTPQHSIGIPLLNQLYPDAKFIHIVRDPRDVATSAWFHFGQSDPRSFETYVHYFMTQVWPVNVGGARQAGPPLGDRYLELRYEDLHAEPTSHIQKVLAFLGVDASDQAIAQCHAFARFEKWSGGRKPGQADPKSFYRTGTRGDWRNHIPIELAQRCCSQIASLMTPYGYDPSCEAVETVAPSRCTYTNCT